MVAEAAIVLGIGTSLFASEVAFKLTHNFVYSRKVAHAIIGGVVLAYGFLFDSPVLMIVLATGTTALFFFTNKREVFKGIQRNWRSSEIYFAAVLIPCYASWYIIDPWIGTAAVLFMAWGDGITGLVRYPLYHTQHEKGWAGSIAMLASCAAIGLLVDPYWIAGIAAIAATFAERQKFVDDNLVVSPIALIVMGGLTWLI